MQAIGDGRYHLVEPLGSGGLSVVWRARDVTSGLDVAVKLPRTDVPGADSSLLREISALKRLMHPNIVKLLDHGSDEGHPFAVLAYLPGSTLEAVLESSGAWDDEATAALGASLADALGAAHGCGIVHGDVKPQNIMLVNGEPCLMDWGTAQDLSDTMPPLELRTLAGTLAYIAPELMAGESPSPESDVFALGVALYRTRSGRLPPRSSTSRDDDRVPLSRVTPDVSPELESLICAAMSPTPAGRTFEAISLQDRLEAMRGFPAMRGPRLAPPHDGADDEQLRAQAGVPAVRDVRGLFRHSLRRPAFDGALLVGTILGVAGVLLLFLGVLSGANGGDVGGAESNRVESFDPSGLPMAGLPSTPTPTTPSAQPESTPDAVPVLRDDDVLQDNAGGQPQREKPPKSNRGRGNGGH